LSVQNTPPPPSPPPNVSFSEYSDDPPPLPALPPPPSNWNTFPDPSTVLPQNALSNTNNISTVVNQDKQRAIDLKGVDSSEANKDELMRKRFEFLGIEPEKSEEYQRIKEGQS